MIVIVMINPLKMNGNDIYNLLNIRWLYFVLMGFVWLSL
jgi:hypothetical protein